MKRGWTTLAALICLGAAQAQRAEREAEAPSPDKGVLAVLRRDGIIFPFAAFRGNVWSAPWPGGLRDVELPINLVSIPERWWGGWRPESWRAWMLDGTNREIRTLEPAQFRVHCAMRLGVRTDYRPADAVPVLPAEPFPKDGLVATAGVRVEPIEIVKPASPQWAALAVELLEHFDRVEDSEVSAVAAGTRWRHPFPRESRRQLPVRIESWDRTRVQDTVISFIEAVRSFPPGPEDDGCGLETVFSGWIYHQNGRLAKRADLGARLTYCDRVNATYMLPFGRIQVKDRVYWVAQYSGHESEWYGVTRLAGDRATPVADYFAGSQESCR